MSYSSEKVKNIKLNIILLWFQSFLLLLILIFLWNLKSGQEKAFGWALGSIILSFLILLLFSFSLKSKIRLPFQKDKHPVLENSEKADKTNIHREYIDPKTVAERIFKNTMLKRTISSFGEKILQNLSGEFEIMQGIFYILEEKDKKFYPRSFYAMVDQERITSFSPGEGLTGQAVTEDKPTILSNLPDDYRRVVSGLGNLNPRYLYLIPLLSDNKCIALIEMSSFNEISENRLNILTYLMSLGAKKLIQFREKINE